MMDLPKTTAIHLRRPSDGSVNKEQLFEHIETHLGFTVTTKIEADAQSYELLGHGLKHYCYLLAPIRKGESAYSDYKHRIMGILWFGKRYHYGMVIEIFGKSIESHMRDVAKELSAHLDHEVQVVTRTLKNPRFK